MSKMRIVAALVLFVVFVWHDVAVRGKDFLASTLGFLLPVSLILLGRAFLPRIQPRSRVVLLIVAVLLCIAINLSQLHLHEEWVESLAFGVTLGVMVALVTHADEPEGIRKQ